MFMIIWKLYIWMLKDIMKNEATFGFDQDRDWSGRGEGLRDWGIEGDELLKFQTFDEVSRKKVKSLKV